jgi:hypothetical protein
MSRPRFTATAVVAAPPDQVWPALLASLRYVPASARETILSASKPQRLRVPLPADEGGAAGHVTVSADPAQRTVSITGAWWYRGVYTVTPHPEGSQVRYEVFNAALPPTRWLVPLVIRGLAKQQSAEFTESLRRTADELHTTWHPGTT